MATILRVFNNVSEIAPVRTDARSTVALPSDVPSFLADVAAHLQRALLHPCPPTSLPTSAANAASLRAALEAAVAGKPAEYVYGLVYMLNAECTLLESAYCAVQRVAARVSSTSQAATRMLAPTADSAACEAAQLELLRALEAVAPESCIAAARRCLPDSLAAAAVLAPPEGADPAWVAAAAVFERSAVFCARDSGAPERAMRAAVDAAVADVVSAVREPAREFIAARTAWCDGPALVPNHGALATQAAFLCSVDIAHWFAWCESALYSP